MNTKSRESIYGSSIRHSAERAAAARKEADRLACAAWNQRMLGYKRPAQPSPALGDARGLRPVWRWSVRQADFYRTRWPRDLSVFILGCMNSVFIYARRFLGIPTDCAFATGGRAGLLHDAWNIRLVPHYTLGVFFVLAHLFSDFCPHFSWCGEQTANRMWLGGAALSLLVAIATIAGMCGVRLA